ncbi:MAG: YdcF family protein [Cyclobacteriaceae bacterium]|nr:YdcF family protein [Cyclobacteriaceae bacterium]MCX7638704.1 YdcF family protein [Cyclobacteriaceae bacterium]MDW8332188.1 ElyC/SanA/YdcF family protein [Cyclobacteriaceae bacterium]
MKFLFRTLLAVFLAGVAVLIVLNVWVVQSTKHLVYNKPQDVPQYKVGLVPGTSNRLSSGSPNAYFQQRIEAAAQLFRLNKIRHIIVSGDNRTKYYNEPLEMKKALIASGVPASAITLDYAGLRTLDSIVRSKKIFGQQRLIIITQSFHAYRALFICRFEGIDAVALAAGSGETDPWLSTLREYFARAIAVLDLYILNTQPRFLGEPEFLPLTDE